MYHQATFKLVDSKFKIQNIEKEKNWRKPVQ